MLLGSFVPGNESACERNVPVPGTAVGKCRPPQGDVMRVRSRVRPAARLLPPMPRVLSPDPVTQPASLARSSHHIPALCSLPAARHAVELT